jgi:DNA-binding beta-propeller fold protein YncE
MWALISTRSGWCILSERWRKLSLVVVALFGLIGCGEPDVSSGPARVYEAGEAVCEGGVEAPRAAVFPDVQTTGVGPNVIKQGDDYLWIVESLDNSISRFDPATGTYDLYFIDVGNDRNPYDLHIDEEKHLAYITNWVAGTLTVASTQTGEVVAEIGVDTDDFDAPQGVTASDDYIYVTNTHYRSNTFDEGSVTVVDRDSLEVVARVATTKKNPQFAETIVTSDGPRIVIVSSGDIGQSGVARSDGAVELWAETDEPGAPDREVFVLESTDDQRHGAPGRPLLTPDGTRLYMPSATAPALFALDLEQKTWLHDTADPLTVYDSQDLALDTAAIDSRGIIYVTAFNEDALYLVDTSCDEVLAGPIDLGVTSLGEGPQDVQIVEASQGATAFFIMGGSNVMGKVELEF